MADLQINLLLFLEQGRQDVDDILADGSAVFDEFDIVACDQAIGDYMGQPDNLFTAQAHIVPTKTLSKESLYRKINLRCRASSPFTFLYIS